MATTIKTYGRRRGKRVVEDIWLSEVRNTRNVFSTSSGGDSDTSHQQPKRKATFNKKAKVKGKSTANKTAKTRKAASINLFSVSESDETDSSLRCTRHNWKKKGCDLNFGSYGKENESSDCVVMTTNALPTNCTRRALREVQNRNMRLIDSTDESITPVKPQNRNKKHGAKSFKTTKASVEDKPMEKSLGDYSIFNFNSIENYSLIISDGSAMGPQKHDDDDEDYVEAVELFTPHKTKPDAEMSDCVPHSKTGLGISSEVTPPAIISRLRDDGSRGVVETSTPQQTVLSKHQNKLKSANVSPIEDDHNMSIEVEDDNDLHLSIEQLHLSSINGTPLLQPNLAMVNTRRRKTSSLSNNAAGSGYVNPCNVMLQKLTDTFISRHSSKSSDQNVDSPNGLNDLSEINGTAAESVFDGSISLFSNYNSQNESKESVVLSRYAINSQYVMGSIMEETAAIEPVSGYHDIDNQEDMEQSHHNKDLFSESDSEEEVYDTESVNKDVSDNVEDVHMDQQLDDMNISPVRLSVPAINHLTLGHVMNESGISMREMLTPAKDRVSGIHLTAREKLLVHCHQTNYISFEKCIPTRMMRQCKKIGEGVYGEVFRTSKSKKETVAMKIIPIEGDFEVNDEPQKKFEEILPEVIISSELSDLRYSDENLSENYIQVNRVSCVHGRYPAQLLKQWDIFQKIKGSENDRPDIFDDNQLFVVFEFADGGCDLESFKFSDAYQAHSVLQQIACSLAVAEHELQFEHRDLHWGNVLVSHTKEQSIEYILDGQNFEVESCGVKVSIIDFTMSRLYKEGCIVYLNLASDETLFEGEGDYQFEVYKKMKEHNKNEWRRFSPFTNVLWIHYVSDKLTKMKEYPNLDAENKAVLRNFRVFNKDVLSYTSASHIIKDCSFLKIEV